MGASENGLILKSLGLKSHPDIGAAEQLRQALEAPAQIENEGVRLVLLEIGDQEIQQERLSRAGPPENHGVGHVAVVEIQEVRRVVVGLKDREIFLRADARCEARPSEA